jgi:hypothetical protein
MPPYLNNAAAAKSIELQLVDIQLGKELGVVLDAQAAKLKRTGAACGRCGNKAASSSPLSRIRLIT